MYSWTEFDEQGRYFQNASSTSGIYPSTSRFRVGEYDDSYYMDGPGKVLKRPTFTPKVESFVGGFTLSMLPVPSTVTVDGETYEVDDGVFEFETPIRSTFKVTIDAWPYRTWRGEVQT